MIQSNCEQLDPIQQGDEVTVSFNLKGRKWADPKGETKYINSLQAWRIERKSASPGDDQAPNTEWMKEDFSQDDDLPF